MGQNKVKILVACHKPDSVYQDEVYTPIHVGRAISKYKNEMSGMIGDDTGDSISEKNPNYCELTAQYWGWKNLDCEYIGLCHYRRYFEQKITVDNVDNLLGDNYDALCIKQIHSYMTMSARLVRATCLEDFQIFVSCLKKVSPEYYDTAKKVLEGCDIIPYNMFVMKKSAFNKFAEWQFSVIAEMEKYVKLSGYSRARRIYGYFTEIMLLIYFKQNNMAVRYSPLVSMQGDKYRGNAILSWGFGVACYIHNKLFGSKIDVDIPAVIGGLKSDGINIE